MNLQSIYEDEQEYEEHNIIKYKNGIVEINGPHDTRVVHTNRNSNINYFDIKPLLLIIADVNGDFSKDQRCEIFTLYGNIGGYEYKITINGKSPMVEMVNTSLNITNNFSSYEIPELEYPVYQFTSNPMIVLALLFTIACYVSDQDGNSIMYAAEVISDNADKDETYYLDEFGMLIMSVYQQCYWIKQGDMLKIIDEKMDDLKDKAVDLEMENLSSDNVYVCKGSSLTDIKHEIKKLKTKMVAYARLESMVKLTNSDDEIMEIKIGNKSHFMVKRDGNIMTMQKDEFNTPKFIIIDPELKTFYMALCQSHDSIVSNYNNWCNQIVTRSKAKNKQTYMPYCS